MILLSFSDVKVLTCFAFGSRFAVWIVVGGVDQIFKLLDQRTQALVDLVHLWH